MTMTPRVAVCSVVLTAAWCVGLAGVPCRGGIARQQQTTVPSTAEMEDDLFRALNAERAARGVPAVRVSPELVELARKHSAEMARRDVLSHESETGKSYQQRLTDAGVRFAGSGENVGRGNTSLTRLIHQAFMESAGHRENILTAAFDSVGIGVVGGRRGTYFVTVDFITSVVPKSAADIREMMLGALNDARARVRLSPVVLLDAVNNIAEDQAQARASGRALPRVLIASRRTSMRFVTGPDLDQLAAAIREQEVEGFGVGGIGSTFSRSREYPGGAYVVCIFLVRDGS
jgi:uncharacterized protein YkwD